MNLLTKFLLISLGSFVLIILFGVLFFQQSSSYFLRSVSQNNQLITEQIQANIDHILFERYLDIWTISEDNLIQNYLSGDDTNTSVEAVIKKYSITTGPWDHIDILNWEGEVVLSSRKSHIGLDLSHVANIKDKLEIAKNEIYYSDALRVDGVEKPVFVYIAPIKSQSGGQQLVGYVMTEIPWDLVLEQIASGPQNTDLYLFNAKRELIGSTNKDIGYFSKLGEGIIVDETKAEESYVLGPGILDTESSFLRTMAVQEGRLGYGGSGWFLLSETPASVVLSQVNQASSRILILFVVFSLIFFFAVFLIFNRYFISPIRKLTKTVKEIASGKQNIRSSIKSGDEIGVLATSFNQMTDKLIIETQEAKFNELRLKASIRDLPIGFILADQNGKIILSNMKQKVELFKITDENWKFDEFNELNGLEFDWEKYLSDVVSSKSPALIKQIKYQNDRYLKIDIVPVFDLQNKEVVNVVILIEDITEEIKLSKTRDEFFALASHELRTPLTSIRGNASMIEEHFFEKIKDPDLKEMVHDIYDSSVTLISIVEDFLDVSRLEQNRLDFNLQRLHTKEILDSVFGQVAPLAKEKNIQLIYNPGESHEIYADKKKTEQILINLISNAIKFTDNGGKAEISVLDEESFIRFKIKDTGRGIAKENQGKLFQKFSQSGDNPLTRDATQGTGLGLYISKLLIQGMGGRIFLDQSDIGKGSTFSFIVPKYFEGIENQKNIS